MKISEKTIELLKEKLKIPKDYTIFYTTSATECWEIIAQSLTNKRSHHIYNGSFGEKWFDYTKKICSSVKSYPFQREEIINTKKFRFEDDDGVICLTQNETSNGTQISNDNIREIKKNNPKHLVAVDVTSSIAGIYLDFNVADIWLASVQKCFGLPAGLGLLICSPKSIDKARAINENNHYNSLGFMADMMEKYQTPFTPNVLNIYLLMRVMEKAKSIEEVHAKILKRYDSWVSYFGKKESLQHLIRNEEARSYTVIPVIARDEVIGRVKSRAKSKGILLGEGYGPLKPSTFRIANFPAIKKAEIRILQDFLADYK
jgi:phosphoserine aminotransferase